MKCIVEMRNICREFPGVKALKGVNLKIHENEILGYVGENGAGKSTLMKILCGADMPNSGQILLYGKPVVFRSPRESQDHGIYMVQQELSLVPSMTVMDNILLGREKQKGPFGKLDFKENLRITKEALESVGLDVDPLTPVYKLSVAEQQMIEIARNLIQKPKVLILDEPTTALSVVEIERLLSILKKLRDQGVGIIFISHKLEEVLGLCDTINVQRDGETVGTYSAREITRPELISLMVGRKLADRYPRRNEHESGKELLRVENLTKARQFTDVSFAVKAGEIVGIFGLKGSGRTEMVTAVFGANQPDSGKVYVHNKEVKFRSPKDAIDHGLALLTEDRKALGLFLDLPVKDNITVSNLEDVSSFRGVINSRKELKVSQEYIGKLGVKTPTAFQKVKYLSGGNQQKVLLARWIYCGSDILIFDEPTKGIDVGAKSEVYMLMSELAAEGKGIVMISSEIDEILAISDIVVVMRAGRVSAILKKDETTREEIMHYAAQ